MKSGIINMQMSEVDELPKGMSFTYSKKSKGPRQDPCGTPLSIG